MVVFLLFFDDPAHLSFALEPTRDESLRVPPVLLEDGAVVEVLQVRERGDHSLAVVGDVPHDGIALQVQDAKLRHLGEDFRDDLGVLDVVVGEVQRRDGRVLEPMFILTVILTFGKTLVKL